MKNPGNLISSCGVFALVICLYGCASAPPTYDSAMDAFKHKDYQSAVLQFQKLSDAGDPRAQIMLAGMIVKGLGLGKKYELAELLYEKAAKAGYQGIAYAEIGDMHRWDMDDLEGAMFWYLKSSVYGDAIADTNLADMYTHGYYVKQDTAMAKYWLDQAAMHPYLNMAVYEQDMWRLLRIGFDLKPCHLYSSHTLVTTIWFKYDGHGRAGDVRVAGSSGNACMDAAAARAITSAILPPYPMNYLKHHSQDDNYRIDFVYEVPELTQY
jgi:hypothetical protein